MKFLHHLTRWILRSASVLCSLALSAFILLCSGYVLGWNTVSQPAPVISAEELGLSKTESAQIESGFFARPAFGRNRRPGTVSTNSTEASVRRRILRIASRMRPGMREREAGIYARAELIHFNAADLRVALDQLKEAPGNSTFHGLRMALIIRWVRLEPAAAYEYAVEHMDSNSVFLHREKIEDIVLDMWASVDPEGALARWRSLPEEKRASPYRTGRIIRAIGENDLTLALSTMETLPEEYHYESLRALSRTPKNEEQRQVLFDRVAQLSDMKQRAKIIAQNLHGWARETDSETVVAWLDQSDLPKNEFHEVEDSLGRQWFYEDHKGAAEWLLSRATTPERRAVVLKDMTSVWVNYDAAAAAEWLGSQPLDETAAPAMRRLAERIARHHPEDAVEWAAAITDPQEKKHAIRNLRETIERNYPHKAKELMSKL